MLVGSFGDQGEGQARNEKGSERQRPAASSTEPDGAGAGGPRAASVSAIARPPQCQGGGGRQECSPGGRQEEYLC